MLRPGSSIGIEKDDDTYFARLLFAEFFKRFSADVTTKAWFYSLRGNCAMSINRLMGLSPRSYAALLLASDFVTIGRTSKVQVRTDELKEKWLKKDDYGLGGTRDGCAEHTQSNVKILRNDLVRAETELAECVEYKNCWEKDDYGGKRLTSLKGKFGRRKAALERPNLSAEQIDSLEKEMCELKDEIDELNLTQQNIRDAVEVKKDARKEALKQLNEFTKKWKKNDDSIYSGIDKILQRYGIERCAYHGGQINGVDVRKLMENAKAILGEICVYLCNQLTEESSISADEIGKLCKDCEEYLSLWDGAIAFVHEENPSDAHCVETQERIDCAMEKHRKLGFNVTPKTHGMEMHVVDQMRRIKGGIKKLIEHWVEHYHQVGHRYDIKWRNQKNEKLKAEIRGRREFTASHPEVLKRLKKLLDNLRKRKTPSDVTAAGAKKKRIKLERRAEYVEQAKANRDQAAMNEAAMTLATMFGT